jgi:hypothetical protein
VKAKYTQNGSGDEAEEHSTGETSTQPALQDNVHSTGETSTQPALQDNVHSTGETSTQPALQDNVPSQERRARNQRYKTTYLHTFKDEAEEHRTPSEMKLRSNTLAGRKPKETNPTNTA